MKSKYLAIALIGLLIIGVTSCKKDKEVPTPNPNPADSTKIYTVPTTYNFTNVNYSGQTYRLNMVDELINYLKTGNTSGTIVSYNSCLNMLENSNNPFTDSVLNACGKKLKDKIYAPDLGLMQSYLDSVAQCSQSTQAGSNGNAGVLISSNGSSKYLVNRNGFEYTQFFEKGMQGGLMYYQICEIYLSPDKIGNSVDNTNIVNGEGTAMEHHWDEAFGYFGAPVDFPANVSGIRHLAKYGNSRNALINCNSAIMNAFLKGRAAISAKDYTTRDQQVSIIKNELEKILASTAISYLNKAKTNITDDALRSHNLSEAFAFILALKYNSARKISDSQMQQALQYLGTNFYQISVDNINAARDLISTVYGFDSIKTQL